MTGTTLAAARTFLFVPGDRPDRYEKAYAAQPGRVVIDLEDAVVPGAKEPARVQVEAFLAGRRDGVVRVNAAGTPWHAGDLDLAAKVGAAVVLPKAEDPDAVVAVAARLGGLPLIALIETARGVLNAPAIAATPGVSRLAFGSYDLAAELGVSPDDREAMASARGALVLASAAAGLAGPIDGVTGDVRDADALRSDTEYARRRGFTGRLCIHPGQVPLVEELFAPTAAELSWARAIVAAVHAAPAQGAVLVGGRMVDKPVLDRAVRLLGSVNETIEVEDV